MLQTKADNHRKEKGEAPSAVRAVQGSRCEPNDCPRHGIVRVCETKLTSDLGQLKLDAGAQTKTLQWKQQKQIL
jgi:hypothetical protein